METAITILITSLLIIVYTMIPFFLIFENESRRQENLLFWP